MIFPLLVPLIEPFFFFFWDCYWHEADQQNQDKPGRGRAQNMERDNGQLGKRKRNDGISSRFPKRDVLESILLSLYILNNYVYQDREVDVLIVGILR